LHDHVPQVKADADLDLSVRGLGGVALVQVTLDVDRTAYSADDDR